MELFLRRLVQHVEGQACKEAIVSSNLSGSWWNDSSVLQSVGTKSQVLCDSRVRRQRLESGRDLSSVIHSASPQSTLTSAKVRRHQESKPVSDPSIKNPRLSPRPGRELCEFVAIAAVEKAQEVNIPLLHLRGLISETRRLTPRERHDKPWLKPYILLCLRLCSFLSFP